MLKRTVGMLGALVVLLGIPLGGLAQEDSRPPLLDFQPAVIGRENFADIALIGGVGQATLNATVAVWGADQAFALSTNSGFAYFESPAAAPIYESTTNPVSGLQFSPNGRYLLVQDGDRFLRYDTTQWDADPVVFVPTDRMGQLFVRDDGSLLTTLTYGGTPGQCRQIVYSADPADPTRLIETEKSRLYWYAAYCGMVNTEWLLSLGQKIGDTVRYPSVLINLSTGDEVRVDDIAIQNGAPVVSPDLRWWLVENPRDVRGEPFLLFELSADGGFREVSDGFGVYGEDRNFDSVVFSPDGSKLVTASSGYFGHRIHVFDLSQVSTTGQVPVLENQPNYDALRPTRLSFNDDFTATFVSSADGFQIWGWPSREVLWELPTIEQVGVSSNARLSFTTDDRALVVGANLFERDGIVVPRDLPAGIGFFDPTGDLFYSNGNLYRLDGRTLARATTYNLGNTSDVGFSADGSAFWVRAGNEQAGFSLQVWRSNAFALLYERAIFGSEAALNNFVISPVADSILARRQPRTGGSNAQLLLMDIAIGKEYLLQMPAGFSVDGSPSGYRYGYSNDGRYVLLYAYRPLDPEETVSGNSDFPFRQYTYAATHEFAIWDTQVVFETGQTTPTHRATLPISETSETSPVTRNRPRFLSEYAALEVAIIDQSDTLLIRLATRSGEGERWLVSTYSEFLTESRPSYEVVQFAEAAFGRVAFSHDGRLMATMPTNTPQLWGVTR